MSIITTTRGLANPKIPAVFVTAILLLLAISFGCGPPASQGDNATTQDMPELSQEVIEDRINGARVYDVPPESGTGEPIPWGFDQDEPKEINVIDQQMDGGKATIVLDIKTQSSPRSRTLRHLEGQIRTFWELQRGLVRRRWEIVRSENISMKYRDLPKPSPAPTAQPANR